jgi:hypothetical protein
MSGSEPAKRAYLSWPARLGRAWRHRGGRWEILTVEQARARKASDTLFVIGSGPSILELDERRWKQVAGGDSFGINFSYLLDVSPTFHVNEDPPEPWLRRLHVAVLAPRRRRLGDTIWFVSRRQPRRGIHPRYAPEMFPEPARVCIYDFPPRLILDADRPFRAADFARAIRYRGTMSLVLHWAVAWGYRRIVLLGVDPQTPHHFFEALPEMREYVEKVERAQVDDTQPFPLMKGKAGTWRTLDEYLVALSELHLQPRGVELCVGDPASVLCPRIPAFAWDEP